MELNKRNYGDIVIIDLRGDVMGGPEAVKLNEEINQLLDQKSLKVVIDLGAVKRMNSSGLGILINALSTYRQNGGELKLAGASPVVQNLLNITKLSTIFECYDSADAAVKSF